MLSYSTPLKRRFASHTDRSQCAYRTSSPGHSSAPPPTYPTCRFLPRHPEERRFGCPEPTRHLVPPPWFLSTMTVCSARQLQAYCSLVPTLGFTAFPPSPNPRPGRPPRASASRSDPIPWSYREASPQRGSYPSTNSPRQQPYRITAAVAFLRLPLVPPRVPRPPKSAFRAAPQRPPTEAGSRLQHQPKPIPRGEPPREQLPYHRRSHGVSHHCVTDRLPTEVGMPFVTEGFADPEPSKLGPPCHPKATRARNRPAEAR